MANMYYFTLDACGEVYPLASTIENFSNLKCTHDDNNEITQIYALNLSPLKEMKVIFVRSQKKKINDSLIKQKHKSTIINQVFGEKMDLPYFDDSVSLKKKLRDERKCIENGRLVWIE